MLIITPSRDEYTKGLRRARKLGKARVPFNADGASALPHVLLIGLVGAVAWAVFSTEMFGSRWFTVERLGDRAPVFSMGELHVVPFSQILFVLAVWAVLEWGDRRTVLLFGLLGWIVPVLAGMIFIIAGPSFQGVAIFLGGLSGIPSPFYALAFPVDDPRSYMQQISAMFVISVAIYLAVVVWFVRRVKKRHREIRHRVESGDAPPPASREIVS